MHLSVLIGKPVSGGKLEGTLKEGLLHCAVLECEIGTDSLGIHLTLEIGMLKKALDLRAENKT